MNPSRSPLRLLSPAAITDAESLSGPEAEVLAELETWTRTFLMSAHPELGRKGDVCPFVARGTNLNTIRYAVSFSTGEDEQQIRGLMSEAFELFDTIEHPPHLGQYRAVMVGFPKCGDPAGLAALAGARDMLRLRALRRHRMVGLFHQDTQAEGLWNRDFRPLRSPIPLLAIRLLVEGDAAFALRNAALIPTYLQRYRLAGARRLLAELVG